MESFTPKGNIRGPIMATFLLKYGISTGAMVMYSQLCNYAGAQDWCWYIRSSLADTLGLSTRSITNYASELMAANLIVLEPISNNRILCRFLKPDYLDEHLSRREKFASNREIFSQDEENFSPARENFAHRINRNNKYNKKINTPPTPPVEDMQQPPNHPDSALPPAAGRVFSFPDFETVWKAYPKKDAKQYGVRMWKSLLRSAQLPDLDVLLAAIDRQRRSPAWNKEDGRFVPKLGNWLLDHCWENEPSEAEKAAAAREQAIAKQRMAAAREAQAIIEEAKQKEKTRKATFEAFASKFAGPVDDNDFALWCRLYSQSAAPTDADVPSDNTANLTVFLKTYAQAKLRDMLKDKPRGSFYHRFLVNSFGVENCNV